ncbi:hypothetical protein, partial [Saccharibacter floricola]|uniref:hypothetical protein n=1 Tax=Saccharibacter floricola TaxID=231053 RepID=UPI002232AE47
GQALQSVLGALQSSGKGSTLLRSLYAMQGAEAVGSGLYKDQTAKVSYYPRKTPQTVSDTSSDGGKAGASGAASKESDDDSDKSGAGGNLIGVQVNVGFDKSKQTSTQTTQTVQGSQANAGNDVSIIARGDGAHDQTKGD